MRPECQQVSDLGRLQDRGIGGVKEQRLSALFDCADFG